MVQGAAHQETELLGQVTHQVQAHLKETMVALEAKQIQMVAVAAALGQ